MVGESTQNVLLIQIDDSSFAEFEISEFEILRFDCVIFTSRLVFLTVIIIITMTIVKRKHALSRLNNKQAFICLVMLRFNFSLTLFFFSPIATAPARDKL